MKVNMLIDSHAHLNMSQFRHDLDEVLQRARSAGVGEILNIGVDPLSIDETIALSERYDEIFASVGVHPHDAKEWDDDLEEKLKRLLLRKKVLALGEIGLDYYRDLSPRGKQKEVFKRQIGIALHFRKPIVVHCREAFHDVVDILRGAGVGEVGGIFHAFSGGEDEVKEVLSLGFLIGIGGPLTYKNSKLARIAPRFPSSSFVLETDCPYLPPVPYRGKRNEPAYIGIVAERLAGIKGVGLRDIERAAEVNYRRLLNRDRDFPVSVAYELKGNIYINVTGACTNNCVFCPRTPRCGFLYGYNLNLVTDPAAGEMVDAARSAAQGGDHGEIVFCGYGEPTTRLNDMLKAAEDLRGLGMPLRLNTNGHGNLINQRNIVPELEKVFDGVSVSLNAHDGKTYLRLCRPDTGDRAFDSVLDFIRKAAASRMECMVTALDHPVVDLDKCRDLIGSIPGAAFRVRRYNYVVEA